MAFYEIQYGSALFPYKTLSVTSAIIYEEDKASVLGTNYVFSIDAWIFGQTEAEFGDAIETVKCQLHTPRLPFLVRWSPDNTNWTVLYSFSPTQDVSYGPQPQNIAITRFSGGKAARLTFDLRVEAKECFSGACGLLSRPSEVLAYTRLFNHGVDPDGLTRRTVSGKLVITGNAVLSGVSPDAYRNFVVPDVPKWFHRTAQEFSTSADGRTLSYSVTDQEYKTTLPAPITSGDASWTVASSEFGNRLTYTLAGEFSAPANVPKAVLIAAVAQLVSDKFPIKNMATTGLIFEARELTERNFFTRNTLAFNVTATASATDTADKTKFSFTAGIDTIGVAITNSDGIAWIPRPYGGADAPPDGSTGALSSGLIAIPLSLYDSCSSVTNPPGYDYPKNGDTPSGPNSPGGTTPTSGPGSGDITMPVPSPGSYGQITPDQQRAPWFEYFERLSWHIHNHVVTLLPKKTDADPIVFQTAPPTCTLTQAGYAKRLVTDPMDAPKPPDPFYDSSLAVMLRNDTGSEVGQTIGEGPWTEYVTHWHYVMRRSSNINNGIGAGGSVGAPKFANDPRVQTVAPDLKLPAGLILTPS